MRAEDVTREQFARWSLEFDVATGGQTYGLTWEALSPRDRGIYLEEADMYLAGGPENWPLDVLERLEDYDTEA